MNCTNCQKIIADRSKFCRYCGFKQEYVEKIHVNQEDDTNRGKKWGYRLLKILIYILLVTIGAFTLIALLVGKIGSVLLNLVLGIVGVTGFIWMLVGLPVGLIIYFINKGKNNYNGELVALLTLGAFIVLAVVFSAYALLYIIKAVFGVDLVQVSTV